MLIPVAQCLIKYLLGKYLLFCFVLAVEIKIPSLSSSLENYLLQIKMSAFEGLNLLAENLFFSFCDLFFYLKKSL